MASKPRRARARRCTPELHHFGYLLDGEGVALDLGVPDPGVLGRGDGQLAVDLVGVAAGAAGKLHDGLAAVAVQSLGEAARGGDDVVVVPGMSEHALAEVGVEVALTADYHARAAAGALLVVGDLVFREGAVAIRHQRAHGRHDYAVFDLHPAYFEGREQYIVVISFSCFLFVCSDIDYGLDELSGLGRHEVKCVLNCVEAVEFLGYQLLGLEPSALADAHEPLQPGGVRPGQRPPVTVCARRRSGIRWCRWGAASGSCRGRRGLRRCRYICKCSGRR